MTVEPITLRDSCGDDLYVEDTGDGAGREVYVEIQYRSPALSDDHFDQSVGLPEDAARKLRDWLTAWLDAPRLAAREHAEVVLSEQMVDVTIALLKTSAGEWGVCTTYSDEEAAPDLDWFPNETAARAQFYTLIGCVTCDGCDELVDRDDATDHGDGYYCEDCAEQAREEFKRTTFRCIDGGACTWTGLGPALAWNGDEHECPTCGGEVEEVGVAPTEASAP